MPRCRPRVALLFSLTAAVLAGCQGSDKQARHVDPDSASIADEPTPRIKPETFVAAGDLAVTRGDYRQGAFQYEQALKASPADAAACRKLALCYVKAGQLPDAVVAWQRYLKITKGTDDAYGSLGYALELSGRRADAERTYLDGIAAHPDGPLCHINYGLMLVRRNDVAGAVQRMSVVLKPEEVHYNIASTYAQVGRRDLAQFYYRKALECSPAFEPARQKLTLLDAN